MNRPIDGIDLDGLEWMAANMAFRLAMWYSKLKNGTSDVVKASLNTSSYSNSNVPAEVQSNARIIQAGKGAEAVSSAAKEVGEGSLEVISSIPGIETVGDITSTGYYSISGQYDKAALSGIAIFLPGISGSVIKKVGDFASEAKLLKHFEDHGAEFGNSFKNASEYLKGAKDFFNNITDDVIQMTRKNGDVVQYNTKTNEFGVIDKEGIIRTFFKPKRSTEYFKDQIKKEVESLKKTE
jgi:pyocin large subunit-like protein